MEMNLSQNIGMITFRLQVRQYAYCSLILLISYINVTYHQTLRWQCRVQVAGTVRWWRGHVARPASLHGGTAAADWGSSARTL